MPEDGELTDLWLAGVRVVGLEQDRAEWIDLRLEECDISAVVAREPVIRRAEIRATRLRTVMCSGAQIEDVTVSDCPTEQLSLRFSRLRRVVFDSCDLTRVDFYGVDFEHVLIRDCDLTSAAFDNAHVTSLRIVNCTLSGVTGATGLRGARVDLSDLPSLAPSLAGELGIQLTAD